MQKLSTQLGKKLENYGRNRYITSAMALDPRFKGNINYLNESQWEAADRNIVLHLVKDDVQQLFADDSDEDPSSPNNSMNSGGSNLSMLDPDEMDRRQSRRSMPCKTSDVREEIKKELQFVKDHVDPNIKPLDFYAKNEQYLPHLSKAAKHFFLASSSSVESESFFSDATALYGNKQRNRLSADSAQKLLQIRVMQKRNVDSAETINKEREESDSDEEFEPNIID